MIAFVFILEMVKLVDSDFLISMLFSSDAGDRDLAIEILENKDPNTILEIYQYAVAEINNGRAMKRYVYDFLFEKSKQ